MIIVSFVIFALYLSSFPVSALSPAILSACDLNLHLDSASMIVCLGLDWVKCHIFAGGCTEMLDEWILVGVSRNLNVPKAGGEQALMQTP